MYCLDTNAVIDYLDGADAIGAFIKKHERELIFSSTVAIHEVFVGSIRTRGKRGLRDIREDLDWLIPLPLTIEGAAEAALIDAELHKAGEPIGPLDTLIAGIAREKSATLVTRDPHFERISNLDVLRYDERESGEKSRR
ncbi:twitching motility protein PilT [candidate division MSBL1 archaeon SCGC-AAA261F17]|uniref:Ribonuclease VapC n=1 Tax=candidate division MSBL1 archaeon SCGC-AAA261F17 TaxID=1698274 RepID=A0A133V7P1_9EURY|nr:twitching motility protein PilT [candidate division MSBL1 archaeon SCGC-AAA261F17]